MNKYYSAEKNIQIIIALLKENGIKRIIASPGNTNVTFVASCQSDDFFEIYSCVDERSAAYMACGMSWQTGEPVVLSCTGATASRNYMPALTEAYYRKIPILAITSSQRDYKIGNLIAQVTDRRNPPVDVANLSVNLPVVESDTDFEYCEQLVNKAMIVLKRHGGGPVHINLQQIYCPDFSVKELPKVRSIKYYSYDNIPQNLITFEGLVVVFIGSHAKMSTKLIDAIDEFCSNSNAFVLCDKTSCYTGKYEVNYSIAGFSGKKLSCSLLIDIGGISGDYGTLAGLKPDCVWRVSPDGELQDRFGKLTAVFEMEEIDFFRDMKLKICSKEHNLLLEEIKQELAELRHNVSEIPLSYIWLASRIAPLLPSPSCVHFGILSSLRAWNFFEVPDGIECISNVGGFGIDGCLSTCIGSSLVDQQKLHFCFLGDLAFFYDMNCLGNRHIGNNLRILLINNNEGLEMGYPMSFPIASHLPDPRSFNTAKGHYSKKNKDLVKNYVEACGFEYLRATSKQDFETIINYFLQLEPTEKPVFLEVFTLSQDDEEALLSMTRLNDTIKDKIKRAGKEILGAKGTTIVKKVIGK